MNNKFKAGDMVVYNPNCDPYLTNYFTYHLTCGQVYCVENGHFLGGVLIAVSDDMSLVFPSDFFVPYELCGKLEL